MSYTGTTPKFDSVEGDNIKVDGNTISSTNEDGDINLLPDGAGKVTVPTRSPGDDSTAAASTEYVDDAIAAIPAVDLTGYATEEYVDDAIAAIPPVDLTGYATEEYVDDADDAILQSAKDYTDEQIAENIGGGGGGGGSSAFRFNVNGKLSALGTASFPKKRLDGAIVGASFTPTACRLALDTVGKSGNLIIDIRASQRTNVPIIGVDPQFQSQGGSISNILPAQATQSITRAASQINTQSITRPKSAINIDRIIVEDGQMRVLLTSAYDSDWLVGDSVLISNSQIVANNGTFLIVGLGTPQYPDSLLLTNASAVAEKYPGGTDQVSYLSNLGTGSNAIATAQYVYPDGRVIIGGTFTTWNGVARGRLVRLNADGTVDSTFATNIGTGFSVAGADINSIGVLSDGRIVIGGIFTTFNGATRNRLIVLNSDGTFDSTFYTNMGTAFGGNVWTVCVQADDKIVVSGAFTTFNALTRNRIIRLNSDGTEDTTFYTNMGTGLSTATNGALTIIQQPSDGKLLLGGDFTAINAVTRNRFVRLNTDGTIDTTFYTNLGTAFGGQVNGCDVQADGKIVVGGAFTTLNGATRNFIVRLNSDGTEDLTFYNNIGTAPNALVSDVRVRSSDQAIFLIGNFTTIAGQTVNRIVVLNSSGNPNLDWLALTGAGFATQQNEVRHDSNGDVYICGSFAPYLVSLSNDFVKIKSNGVLTKGNVALHLYSYNYLTAVDSQFTVGESFAAASHSTAANNGNKTIYAINQGGNNIWVKSATGVVQSVPSGTADTLRFSYNLGALPSTDFAVGDQLKAASHTTAANNGNLPIVALTATAIIVYNVAGVVQAGVAGTCNTNRWLYTMADDPSASSAVAAGDLIRFADFTTGANNGNFTVSQVNRGGGANRNIVVHNTAGVAQLTGGVGIAVSEKKILKFSADQSSIFSTSSFVELKYLEDANFLGDTKVYRVDQVNRGGGANYNIVVKEIEASRQITVQGVVAVESRSIFDTLPVIAAAPISSADAVDTYTQNLSGLLNGSAIAANRYISLWILENYTDASAVDLTVQLS